jgi:malonate transporter and related proteins
MIDVLNLALPYFGLIFIGFACGRAKGLPETGLAWMNFFLLYVSLPALLFGIMSKTPFEELNNPPFLVATTLGTMCAFALALLSGRIIGRLSFREATLAGLSGGYGNIGYMGPGLALAVLGAKAAAPTALIFCCDSIFLFSIVPLLIALTDGKHRPLLHTLGVVVRQIALNPLIMSACAGALAAALHIHPPVAIDNTLMFLQNAAAPVALFALGVTVALRPFGRVPWEVPAVIAVKLLIHPLIVFGLMLLLGPFAQPWAATAVLMASLPPALNVFVIARQNDTWIEPASVAVLIGTFASVITLTSVMWLIQTGRLVFP